jgi:hypothetical protein
MGATGILRFILFVFRFLSFKLVDTTLPVVPVPAVAEDGYSCPNGTPTATICLLFILFVNIFS